jgi:hypothetical protein
MGFTQSGNTVFLEMSREDYQSLLILCGSALFYLGQSGDKAEVTRTIGLLDRLNVGNPSYSPYGIVPTREEDSLFDPPHVSPSNPSPLRPPLSSDAPHAAAQASSAPDRDQS